MLNMAGTIKCTRLTRQLCKNSLRPCCLKNRVPWVLPLMRRESPGQCSDCTLEKQAAKTALCTVSVTVALLFKLSLEGILHTSWSNLASFQLSTSDEHSILLLKKFNNKKLLKYIRTVLLACNDFELLSPSSHPPPPSFAPPP